MFSEIFVWWLNFTSKKNAILYIIFWAICESCLWQYLKNHSIVDKTAETQVYLELKTIRDIENNKRKCVYCNQRGIYNGECYQYWKSGI